MTRKAAWHFSTECTLTDPAEPALVPDTADSRQKENELQHLDQVLKRLLMTSPRLPLPKNIQSIELKYKLSDWDLARTQLPIKLSVQGYYQAAAHRTMDRDNLNAWLTAEWSPVEGGLRQNKSYKAWAVHDPNYRNLQVCGGSAVALNGPHAKAKPDQFFLALLPAVHGIHKFNWNDTTVYI